MSLKFAFPLSFATALLLFANTSRSDNYTESGDAGDLPSTAQVTTAPLGPLTALTSITGSTTLTNNLSDSDMYEILITGTSAFTASTTSFIAGSNNFDDTLSLFNSSGVGVASNDDATTGGPESSLTVPAASLVAGDYYLLISGSGRYAVDGTGNLIFANFTDGTTDPTSTVGPNSTNSIAGYSGNSNEGGKYVIAISGAQFAGIALVPEPSSVVAIAAGVAGLVLVLRQRRSS